MGYFARLTRELDKNIIISEQPLDDDKISSVKFLSGTDIVEIYEKNENSQDKTQPVSSLPGYKKFYVGKYYSYDKFKEKYPQLINAWGPDIKNWDGICQTLSKGKLHSIPDRENYPIIGLDQIRSGQYKHSHGDKTYFIKFYKKKYDKTMTWTDRLDSLDLGDIKFEDEVFKFKIYAKNDRWETVDEKNYVIGRIAKDTEVREAGFNPGKNSFTFLKTRAGNLVMRDENKFILIPPEQIKNGRYIKNSDNNLTIKYYRHLHGGGETRWEEDGNDDNIENIKFKRGLYRVKFCYKLKDGTIYDEQEFIVGREISASVAKKKYPEVYEKYKDRNPRFVETPFGATIVRCAKCTLIAPEQLVESRFDPYKDKAYLNLE